MNREPTKAKIYEDSDTEDDGSPNRFALPPGFRPIQEADLQVADSPFSYGQLRAKPNQEIWLLRAPTDVYTLCFLFS